MMSSALRKCMEPISHARMSEVIHDVLGDARSAQRCDPVGRRSGRAAREGTTAVVAGSAVAENYASNREALCGSAGTQSELTEPGRLYTNNDVSAWSWPAR